MSLLLRKIDNLNRMIPYPKSEWLNEGTDVPAIMVKEFTPRCPEERGISVWHIEEDLTNLDEVIAAIALAPSRDKLPPIQFIVFEPGLITKCGLDLDQTVGVTCHSAAASWHSEIVGLTAISVGKLTHEVCLQFVKKGSLTPNDVLNSSVDVVLKERKILDCLKPDSDLRARILDEIENR